MTHDNGAYVNLDDVIAAVKRVPTYEAAHGGYSKWVVLHRRDVLDALDLLRFPDRPLVDTDGGMSHQ